MTKTRLLVIALLLAGCSGVRAPVSTSGEVPYTATLEPYLAKTSGERLDDSLQNLSHSIDGINHDLKIMGELTPLESRAMDFNRKCSNLSTEEWDERHCDAIKKRILGDFAKVQKEMDEKE